MRQLYWFVSMLCRPTASRLLLFPGNVGRGILARKAKAASVAELFTLKFGSLRRSLLGIFAFVMGSTSCFALGLVTPTDGTGTRPERSPVRSAAVGTLNNCGRELRTRWPS